MDDESDSILDALDAAKPQGKATPVVDIVAARLFAGLKRPPTISRFELLEVLGSGGMGTVYAAHDPDEDRKVAIKVVRSDLDSDQSPANGEARLMREARLAARLQHPNVVAVLEQGIHNGSVYVVMEFIDGLPLDRWLNARPRSWTEVLAVFREAGAGLAAAHASGIVHRDFKPANVLVGLDGCARVVDFGLARPITKSTLAASGSFDYSITGTGKVSGTPIYMAPELFIGIPASPRSDIYAFCVALLDAWRRGQGGSPSGRAIDVLLRGVSPDPNARWSTMPDLLEALTLETSAVDDTNPADLSSDARLSRRRTLAPTRIGHYDLSAKIGEGGMGVVFTAHDSKLDRTVAIKILSVSDNDERRQRVEREAKAMAKFTHPNVVQVYEFGESEAGPYIVMEYVDGLTLRAWLSLRSRSWHEILAVFRAAGQGLAAVHAKGLVHRDFKPDNLMIDSDGRVRVMDFGLARIEFDARDLASRTSTTDAGMGLPTPLTHSGAILGTPAYMSPEQYRGLPAGAASDQFSFCVTLHEALYGERLFAGETYVELREAIERGRMREPPGGAPIPIWLRELIGRGLSLRPEERFKSMQALLDALVDGERAHDANTRKALGFVSGDPRDVWRNLLTPIANGKVVPIVGPRLLEAAHGDSHKVAMHLADADHYPMAVHEWDDLPRVTAYLSVKESRYNVIQVFQEQLLRNLIAQHGDWLPSDEIPPMVNKPKLGKLLALVGDRLRERENDPYRILAELPASVYMTTNFDPLLERALKANGRAPQQVVTRWRHKRAPASAKAHTFDEPRARSPLVYHVFGAFGPEGEDGLVLTEDDYFDYLISTAAGKLIPGAVESALVDNSLLFLGFRLTDWHFRVLFRLMMNLAGRERLKHYRHVAVQLDPDMQAMSDVDGAKAYLAEYFGKEANVDIYWGSSEEFLVALRKELADADLQMDQPAAAARSREWEF